MFNEKRQEFAVLPSGVFLLKLFILFELFEVINIMFLRGKDVLKNFTILFQWLV